MFKVNHIKLLQHARSRFTTISMAATQSNLSSLPDAKNSFFTKSWNHVTFGKFIYFWSGSDLEKVWSRSIPVLLNSIFWLKSPCWFYHLSSQAGMIIVYFDFEIHIKWHLKPLLTAKVLSYIFVSSYFQAYAGAG